MIYKCTRCSNGFPPSHTLHNYLTRTSYSCEYILTYFGKPFKLQYALPSLYIIQALIPWDVVPFLLSSSASASWSSVHDDVKSYDFLLEHKSIQEVRILD